MVEKEFITLPRNLIGFQGGQMQFNAVYKNNNGNLQSCRSTWWTCRDYFGDYLHYHKPLDKTEGKVFDSETDRELRGWHSLDTDALRFIILVGREDTFIDNLRHLPNLEREVNPAVTPTKVFRVENSPGHFLVEADNFWQSTCANNSLFTLWLRMMNIQESIPDNLHWLDWGRLAIRGEDDNYLDSLKHNEIYMRFYPYLSKVDSSKYARRSGVSVNYYGHGEGGIVTVLHKAWHYVNRPVKSWASAYPLAVDLGEMAA